MRARISSTDREKQGPSARHCTARALRRDYPVSSWIAQLSAHADHPRNVPEPSGKRSFKTFPRLPVPYAFKSGPLNWTPAICTSSHQLLDPTRARTGPAPFGLKNPSSGSKVKKVERMFVFVFQALPLSQCRLNTESDVRNFHDN